MLPINPMVIKIACVGGWLATSYAVYKIKGTSKSNKLKVMSCRRVLKNMDKLDKCDRDSIF